MARCLVPVGVCSFMDSPDLWSCVLARERLCRGTSDMPGSWAPAPPRYPNRCKFHTHTAAAAAPLLTCAWSVLTHACCCVAGDWRRGRGQEQGGAVPAHGARARHGDGGQAHRGLVLRRHRTTASGRGGHGAQHGARRGRRPLQRAGEGQRAAAPVLCVPLLGGKSPRGSSSPDSHSARCWCVRVSPQHADDTLDSQSCAVNVVAGGGNGQQPTVSSSRQPLDSTNSANGSGLSTIIDNDASDL